MESRRNFLKASAAAMTVAATRPLFGAGGIQGANDRVRMAIIGAGNRGGRVFDSFMRQKDCQYVAVAEVNKQKLDQWMTPARQTFKLDVVGDHRRILDRKDVDAVLIATPDHWHSQQMVDAVSAGKDVYVEKPASNIDSAHQRDARRLQEGQAGRPGRHASAQLGSLHRGEEAARQRRARQRHAGRSSSSRARTRARRKPKRRCRRGSTGTCGRARRRRSRSSRAASGSARWYDYGGGLVADWGAHHVDVAHWFMNADRKVPDQDDGQRRVPRGAGRRSGDGAGLVLDLVALRQLPHDVRQRRGVHATNPIENWGVFFVGDRGSLQVNRQGYALRPAVRAGPQQGRSAAAADGGWGDARRRRRGDRAGRGPGGGAAAAGRRARRTNLPPVEAKLYVNPRGGVEEDYPLDAHTRNFLDCLKSRQKPNAEFEIGYYAALPCLLALESMQKGKPIGWDAQARGSKGL